MDLGLKEKVAVVTGGSKGIGFATAKAFLEEGAKVAICARDKAVLDEAVKELSAYGEVYAEAIDVTEEEAVYGFADRVAKHFGTIDAWVNNVGSSFARKGEQYTQEEIYRHYTVNFQSAVFGCQAAFRYMKDKGGSIVNVSSLAARCATSGRASIYGPMKAAVRSLSQTFAGEYAAYGVRVNCVMPGFTDTPLIHANLKTEELAYTTKETLLNRAARPEEIAAPIVFLCSDKASFMTGSTVEASGGRSVTLNPTYSWDKKAAESLN